VSDWAQTVRTVALDLSALIADKALDFELETCEARVRAHEWSLRELSRNLLHNAVRHSPVGGRLTIHLSRDGDLATLRISDDGPGIPELQRARLFQAFATDATARGSGSGLGLAICKGLVETLQGRIALDNRIRDGRIAGLDARVELPLAAHDASPAARQ
jgi:two-component system, OmpR family, sensor histidine kinase TctE